MKSVPDMLREGAATYEERNAAYGDSYKQHGTIMQALFPEGVPIDSPLDHNRFGVLTLIVSKLNRYVNNFHVGGHDDSLLDLAVYATMLRELDQEARVKEAKSFVENINPTPADAVEERAW